MRAKPCCAGLDGKRFYHRNCWKELIKRVGVENAPGGDLRVWRIQDIPAGTRCVECTHTIEGS